MKFTSNVKSFFLYLVFFVLILVLFELFTRTFIFYYSKDINIYKIGIDKKYVLDIEDLTEKKFNVINLSKNDTEIQENKKKTSSKVYNNVFYVFGGSSTYGNNCGPVGSWVDELQLKMPNSLFLNFGVNGGDSDYSVHKLLKEINSNKNKPDYIIWANKFNERNVIFKGSSYRNFNKLDYNFLDEKVNFFISFSHSLSISLRNYLVSYNLLENTSKKVRKKFNNIGIIDIEKNEMASKKDFEMASKNYEINTIDAIKFSKEYAKKFIILHLNDSYNKNTIEKINLKYSFSQTFKYDDLLIKLIANKAQDIENKNKDFVKFIDLDKETIGLYEDDMFCEDGSYAHKTKKGNVFTSNLILNNFKDMKINY